jgi:hypothetical protein
MMEAAAQEDPFRSALIELSRLTTQLLQGVEQSQIGIRKCSVWWHYVTTVVELALGLALTVTRVWRCAPLQRLRLTARNRLLRSSGVSVQAGCAPGARLLAAGRFSPPPQYLFS